MDNNPFRNNQPNVSNTGYGQPQQSQQPQGYGNNMGGGYSSGYTQPQQPQQQQAWQNNSNVVPSTPYSPIAALQQPQNTSFSSLPQQQSTYTPTPPPFQQQQQYTPPYNSNTSLMSSTTTPTVGVLGGNTYQPYQATATMPTPNTSYQPQQYGMGSGMNSGMNNGMGGMGGIQQPQPQYGSANNFYIPANFGQSTPTTTTPNTYHNNSNMFQPQQPRHAPVDASTLLKGTQVRRVECPVCQKMLEGDDMAVNHHVNEHYS